MTTAKSAPLPALPAILARPTRPLATLLTAWILSISGSLALSALIGLIAPAAAPPDFGWLTGRGFYTLIVLSVLAPLIETLVLALTTSLLLLLVRPSAAILLSSLGWAAAHSLQAPIWGLVIWWPFLVFTTLYVVWKQRSLAWGLAMAFLVHAMQNLVPAVAVGFPELVPAL